MMYFSSGCYKGPTWTKYTNVRGRRRIGPRCLADVGDAAPGVRHRRRSSLRPVHRLAWTGTNLCRSWSLQGRLDAEIDEKHRRAAEGLARSTRLSDLQSSAAPLSPSFSHLHSRVCSVPRCVHRQPPCTLSTTTRLERGDALLSASSTDALDASCHSHHFQPWPPR